jgi:hypothetical protein
MSVCKIFLLCPPEPSDKDLSSDFSVALICGTVASVSYLITEFNAYENLVPKIFEDGIM